MNPTFSPRRKAPELRLLPVALAAAFAAGGALAQTAPATNALPVVNTGFVPRNATIGAQTGTTAAPIMNINQNAARGVIEWQSFDIGSAARVNIVQPTAQSVLVNRVVGANAPLSQIYGAMNANGRVFLVNPAGIVFGAGAQVNVGSLVASTLDLTPAMTANNYAALLDPATTTLQLAGTGTSVLTVGAGAVITADPAGGGSVVLTNTGSIGSDGTLSALRGHIALATGNAADLVLPATTSGFVDLVVTQASGNSTFIGLGATSNITAEGGSVVLGATSAAAANRNESITLRGVINVGSTTGAAGTVVVDAGDGANSAVALVDNGVIAARGTAAGQTGGTVTLLGSNIVMDDRGPPPAALPTLTGFAIDVGGNAAGGTITVGDDATRRVSIGAGNTLGADATTGAGGTISLFAMYVNPNSTFPQPRIDYGVLEAYGTLLARGPTAGGTVRMTGQSVNTRLTQGGTEYATYVDASSAAAPGTWVINAPSITVTSTVPAVTSGSWQPNTPGGLINNDTITDTLDRNTNVTLNAGLTGTSTGGLFVDADVALVTKVARAGPLTLSMTALENVEMFGNSAITAATGAPLNVVMRSDRDGDGNGGVNLASQISTGGGNFEAVNGSASLPRPATGTGVQLLGASIDTNGVNGAGNIAITGTGAAGAAGIDIDRSFLSGADVSLLGNGNTRGVAISNSTVSTNSGTVNVVGTATRTSALSVPAVGLLLDNATFSIGSGSLALGGRGDDSALAGGPTTGTTGLQYSGLRILTGGATPGNIVLAGEAVNSTGAGIRFDDVGTGGLEIRSGTSTNIPTLSDVSIGAISSDGLALALGLDNPDATRVLTQGSIGFRPLHVTAAGQITEAPEVAITVGATTASSSGFIVDPQAFGQSLRADTGFVFGSDAQVGAITVLNGALSGQTARSFTFQNTGAQSGGITLGSGIQVRDLGLLSLGNVTQTAGFTVDGSLVAGGGGTFTLTSAGNAVGGNVALAAPGALNLLVDGALAVGVNAPVPRVTVSATSPFAALDPLVLSDSTGGQTAVLRSTNAAVSITHDIAMAAGGQLALVSPVSITVDDEVVQLTGGRVQAWAPLVNWAPAGRLNFYGCTYPTCVAGVTPSDTGLQALFPDRPTLTVVADNASGPVGGPFPPLTYTNTGLVNGDTAATALAGALGTDATSASPAGTYAINQGTLVSPNGYLINYTPGTLALAGTVTPPSPQTPVGLEDGRETIRSAFLAEYRSDVYGRNLAQPFICTATSVISDSVARETVADPLASEWGKVRNQPQLSGCLDVSSGGQCAAF